MRVILAFLTGNVLGAFVVQNYEVPPVERIAKKNICAVKSKVAHQYEEKYAKK